MAEVWEGFDHNLNRRIAIKMMHPHLAADESILNRFRSEARAAARLTHPAIVAIYDTVSTQDNDAIIMEFVEGDDLRTILNDKPTLATSDAVEVALQLAGALAHAHQNGIVHRDVKPANILVRPDRRVKLSDFGIAKALDEVGHTETGSLMGTVKYLAPEQIEGNPVDGRTDLYGLTTVLYEMLCGKVPFAATDLMGAMQRLRKDPPSARTLRPDLPLALDSFLQKGLARNPDDRFVDANEWASALSDSTVGNRLAERGDPTVVDKRPSPSSSVDSTEPSPKASIPQAPLRPRHIEAEPKPASSFPTSTASAAPATQRSAKERAKANPDTAKHLKRSKSRVRWLGPVISLLLMVAAVATVWFLLTDAGSQFVERLSGDESVVVDETEEQPAVAAEQPESPAEPTIDEESDAEDLFDTDFDAAGVRATSFDPQGDGEEHEEAVSRPFDGDTSTFWLTQLYRDRTFGQLKEGVGLIVEFEEPRSIQDIAIDANRTGWALDIFAADTAPASLDLWGQPIGSFEELTESEVLDVEDRDVGALLFWVTDLGLDPTETVEQYEEAVASGIVQQLQISEIELLS